MLETSQNDIKHIEGGRKSKLKPVNKEYSINKIEDRIKREGLSIEEGPYAYNPTFKVVFKPSCALEENIDNSTSIILAHELGHHYQRRNKVLSCFYKLCEEGSSLPLFNVLFYPIILVQELDAWIRARRICKEEAVDLDGFFETMYVGFSSYLKTYVDNCVSLIKSVLHMYLSIVFLFGFIMLSEKLSLNQPEWLLSVRQVFTENPNLYNDLMWPLFGLVFCCWLITKSIYAALFLNTDAIR